MDHSEASQKLAALEVLEELEAPQGPASQASCSAGCSPGGHTAPAGQDTDRERRPRPHSAEHCNRTSDS